MPARAHPFRHRPARRAFAAADRGAARAASWVRLHDRRAADHRGRADDARVDRAADAACRQAATRVLLPGYCTGDLAPIEAAVGVPVERGPRDLRQSARFLRPRADAGRLRRTTTSRSSPRSTTARGCRWPRFAPKPGSLAADGADVIDVGCEPDGPWTGVADVVRALRDDGHRVSIDSLDPREIEPAVRAGAELVLSVNSSNRDAARDWGCEVVVVPDDPRTLAGSTKRSTSWRRPACGCGSIRCSSRSASASPPAWAATCEVRERYPDAEMMMGIGNLTELTDADSAGVNVVLLGFCQELGIRSVLTTQVINWARSSVRECDLARRLVYHSVRHRVLPKHLEPRLVMLRDPAVTEVPADELERLVARDQGRQLPRVRRAAAKCTSSATTCICTMPIRSSCSNNCGTAAPTDDCPRIWTRRTRFTWATKCARRPRRSRSANNTSRTSRSTGAF